jgi:hypothetical protein
MLAGTPEATRVVPTVLSPDQDTEDVIGCDEGNGKGEGTSSSSPPSEAASPPPTKRARGRRGTRPVQTDYPYGAPRRASPRAILKQRGSGSGPRCPGCPDNCLRTYASSRALHPLSPRPTWSITPPPTPLPVTQPTPAPRYAAAQVSLQGPQPQYPLSSQSVLLSRFSPASGGEFGGEASSPYRHEPAVQDSNPLSIRNLLN